MTKFENFEKAFKDRFDNSIWEFIDEFESDRNPLNAQLIQDLDEISHDSYGSEDSTLKRVFYFEDFDIYVMFEGTRCSYQGEEWDEYREVKKVEKIINTWE